MKDMGALKTSNVNKAKPCQNVDGCPIGTKLKNCQARIGKGRIIISDTQLSQNRRKLVLAASTNILANCFMRFTPPNVQKLSHGTKNGNRQMGRMPRPTAQSLVAPARG